MLNTLKNKIQNTLAGEFKDFQGLPEVIFTPAPSHVKADISLTWALSAAKVMHKNPLEIAKKVCEILESFEEISSAALLPPGFINIVLSDEFLVESCRDRRLKDRSKEGIVPTEKVLIEFVSANPTGPLHVASGRGASLGDSLVKIFRALGHAGDAEY